MMSDADVLWFGEALSLMDEEKEMCPSRSCVVTTLKGKGGCEEEEAQKALDSRAKTYVSQETLRGEVTTTEAKRES